MTHEAVSVIPNEQVRALMTTLQSRKIQEAREIILNDRADDYLRTGNFLAYLGLGPGSVSYDIVMGTKGLGALSRATSKMDPYLRLQMIGDLTDASEEDYAAVSPRVYTPGEGPEAARADAQAHAQAEREEPEGGQ